MIIRLTRLLPNGTTSFHADSAAVAGWQQYIGSPSDPENFNGRGAKSVVFCMGTEPLIVAEDMANIDDQMDLASHPPPVATTPKPDTPKPGRAA